MRIYKPSKIPLILIYVLLFLILLVIKYALNIINSFVEIPDNYILLPIWIVAALFAVLVLPFYFHKAQFTVTSKEITARGGLIITTKHFMLTDSVKSVTTIITPLGGLTGLNFVVLNTLGARVLLPFLSKRDALEIVAVITSAIRSRKD
jgi:membrane protein YdbS with pleckstrin-like domain